MNEVFSPILLVSYALDLVVSISFAAWVIGWRDLYAHYGSRLNCTAVLTGSPNSPSLQLAVKLQAFEDVSRNYVRMFTGMGLIDFSSGITGARSFNLAGTASPVASLEANYRVIHYHVDTRDQLSEELCATDHVLVVSLTKVIQFRKS
ncbi:hypothetical protein BV898_13618 [Hypsibius exemplaris]|uniref:Uncharacterized protein n=1 Tax=Hypsibius exemplaris TaxID=2072580 RepID=A0A1W0WA26_HYPEX|nr:hypothetical protein BV898_13618 [Hypsibius exemplaris]